jgi:AbrB family looped-hinge helix DNA binding protein
MGAVETARMSSKGQVVIPESIRRQLGLVVGQQFVVMGDGDVIVLKSIERPSIRDFDSMIRDARHVARKVGMRRADVAEAVTRVRGA